MGATSTRNRRISGRGDVPTPTPPADMPSASNAPQTDGAEHYRALAQEMQTMMESVKAALSERGLTLTDLLKPAPADPYAGKSPAELATMAANGDTGARDRLIASLTGATSEPTIPDFEAAPEIDDYRAEIAAMDETELMFAIVDARRGESDYELDMLESEWTRRKGAVQSAPQTDDEDNRYGEFTAAEVRHFLRSTTMGQAICAAAGVIVGETGRLSERVIAAAVEGLRASRPGNVSAPSIPVASADVEFSVPTESTEPKLTGRGGLYSDEANAFYRAEAERRLATRGLTVMDLVKRTDPRKWGTISLGGSDIKNGQHGNGWTIPNLSFGPLTGKPCIQTGFRNSDTQFAMYFAGRLAHEPRFAKVTGDKVWTDANTYADLARGVRPQRDGSFTPDETQYNRAANIMARLVCAGFFRGI